MHIYIYISCSDVYKYIASVRWSERLFRIFRPKDLKLWVPNLLGLINLTMMLLCFTFGFFLDVNTFFM